MNADLKRVRDSSADDGPSSSKRRAINSPTSSPSCNNGSNAAEDDGIEDWMRVVETKRKEAIYRQMLDYRRSYEREHSRATALERQRQALEASLRGVEACWAQLVSSVRERAGRPDAVKEDELLDSTIDVTKPQSELDNDLQSRLLATERLVSIFADIAAGKKSADLGGDLHQQLAKLQAEASTLRANSAALQSKIDDLRQSRDTYNADLQRAEKRLDRQRMEFDKERAQWREGRETSAATLGKAVANGSGHSTPNATRTGGDQDGAASGAAPMTVVGSAEAQTRIEELEVTAKQHLQQLESLRAEHTSALQELDRVKVLAHHPSEASLRESPFFQVYLTQLATQFRRADALQTRFETSEQKLDQLRDSNLEFREAVLQEARQEVEALRQQISKKDTDLARLRGQRDEMNAELSERRARDHDKQRHTDEIEALAAARQERLTFLQSEVRRLKGQLAAQDGAEGYLAFLKADGGVDGDYIKDLEAKLKEATDKAKALGEQIEARSEGEAAASAAESAIRLELETARQALAKYGNILGADANPASDIKQLAERLEKTSETNKRLELRLAEAEESTNALYTEVEGLSKLWEGLEHTLRTKVFELKDSELKMARLNTEKAKADNKYFQAMRTKEAIDAECKTAQRLVDKQARLLERAQEVERALQAQISQQEKGVTSLKNSGLELQTQLATVTQEKRQLELRLQQSQATLAEAQQVAHVRVAEAAADKSSRVKLQDELDDTHRQLKRNKEKLEHLTAAGAAGNMSLGEARIREEHEKLLKLLRCSCCELNFKQQVITKCMHTFCKECIDQRIASRQRKCPACGLAFAKEDCQTLYWQ